MKKNALTDFVHSVETLVADNETLRRRLMQSIAYSVLLYFGEEDFTMKHAGAVAWVIEDDRISFGNVVQADGSIGKTRLYVRTVGSSNGPSRTQCPETLQDFETICQEIYTVHNP